MITLFKHLYTLLVVLFGWVLFRADTLSYGIDYIKLMLGFGSGNIPLFLTPYYLSNFSIFVIILGVFLSVDVPRKILEKVFSKSESFKNVWEGRIALSLKSVFSVFLLVVDGIAVISSTYNPFIYFRF